MTQLYTFVSFSVLILLAVAADAWAKNGHNVGGGNLRPTKTRQFNHDAKVIEDLISINLDTEDLSEATSILRDMGMNLVSREGLLDNWYIASPSDHRGPQGKRAIMEAFSVQALDNPHVLYWENVLESNNKPTMVPTDPLFYMQWNLKNDLSVVNQSNVVEGTDISATTAWDLGYDGSGVHIQYIDDGLDGSHPEFAGRFLLGSSWNFITNTQNPNNASDSHGTSCAGISAGAMNNSVCGAGIAYGASVSGIRFIGYTSSATNAQALTGYSTTVNVSSNSWGKVFGLGSFIGEPQATHDALYSLAQRKAIPLFAAGNSHREFSSCSHQELTSSPFVIVVGAHNDQGTKSAYSSECSNVLISAPSSDSSYTNSRRLGITSAKTGGGCTTTFGGTSAATPTVSGVVALMKQANPSIGLREIQRILIDTADPIDFLDASWTVNAANFLHSNKYGFGKLNANKAVLGAKNWTTVLNPVSITSASSTSPFLRTVGSPIPDDGTPVVDTVQVSLNAQAKVEYVGVYIKANHSACNQLEVTLTSPLGTVAPLTQPFARTDYYDAVGTQIYAFASPYWNGTTTTLSIPNYQIFEGCNAANVPNKQSSTATALVVYSAVNAVDGRCENAVQIIEAAAAKGFNSVIFFGFADFVDWDTTTKTSVIPSFFWPAWQDNSAEELTTLTAMTNLGSYKAPGSQWNYFLFGSWKTYGENPNGDWTLSIADKVRGVSGTFDNWLVQFMYSAPPPAPAAPPGQAPLAGTGSPQAAGVPQAASAPSSGGTTAPSGTAAPSRNVVNGSSTLVPFMALILLGVFLLSMM